MSPPDHAASGHRPGESSARRTRLIAAFEATDYRVETPEGIRTLRIGRRDPVLDRVLGNRPWALITAHNPGGRRRDDAANRRAARRLQRRLRALQPAVMWASCNRDPSGRWPDEPGWLFVPGALREVDRLALEFGQAAVVVGEAGRPPRLRRYPRPSEAGDAEGTSAS